MGQVELKYPEVHTNFSSDNLEEASLTMEVEIQNHLENSVKGKLVCYIDSFSFSLPISLKPTETKKIEVSPQDIQELTIKNPRVWWCTNLGNPEMYNLKMEFLVRGEVIDTKQIDFPIREVIECIHRGKKRFSLNGRKLNVRGINCINTFLPDNILHNDTLQIKYLRNMNINSICTDDVDISPDILSLCDKNGLLVIPSDQCKIDTLKMSVDSMMNVKLAFEKSRIRVNNLVYPCIEGLFYTDSIMTTAGYYDVKRANQTQQLIYSYKKNAIYFVNDNVTGPVEKKAHIAMYDLNSTLLHEATIDFRVESDWSKKIFELDDMVGNSFLNLQLLDNKGNEEASNFYCLSENNDRKAFLNLPRTTLIVTPFLFITGEILQLDLKVFNESDAVSLSTYFTVKDENNNEIYPFFWSDNYVSIVPGTTKNIRYSIPLQYVRNKQLKLHVSGLNLDSMILPLEIPW